MFAFRCVSPAFIAEVCHTDQSSSPRLMDAFDPSAEMSVLFSTVITVGISLSMCKQEFPRKNNEAEKHMKEATVREGSLGVILVYHVRGLRAPFGAWLKSYSQSNSGDWGKKPHPQRHEVASMQAPPRKLVFILSPLFEVLGRTSPPTGPAGTATQLF